MPAAGRNGSGKDELVKKLIIGSRGSKLALWQAEKVKAMLIDKVDGLEIEIRIIKTSGDARHDLSPGAFGTEGIFTAELDRALKEREIDMAVHSLKDLPTKLEPGLTVAAVSSRASIEDLFLVREDHAAKTRPSSADDIAALGKLTVGTSSLRRVALLKNRFPELEFAPMRGNLDTRVRKLGEGEYDAIVVAKAGMDRLEVDTGAHGVITLSPEWYLPAAGQGALAIETADEGDGFETAKVLDHPETRAAVTAERVAMSALGAGCRVPAGFLADIVDGKLKVRGIVGHPDGEPLVRAETEGDPADAEDIGRKLAEELKKLGATDILKEVRG